MKLTLILDPSRPKAKSSHIRPHVRVVGKRKWIEVTNGISGVISALCEDRAKLAVEVSTRPFPEAVKFYLTRVTPSGYRKAWYRSVPHDAEVCGEGLREVFGRIPKNIYVKAA